MTKIASVVIALSLQESCAIIDSGDASQTENHWTIGIFTGWAAEARVAGHDSRALLEQVIPAQDELHQHHPDRESAAEIHGHAQQQVGAFLFGQHPPEQ